LTFESKLVKNFLMTLEPNLEFVCEIENALILIILQIKGSSTIYRFFS